MSAKNRAVDNSEHYNTTSAYIAANSTDGSNSSYRMHTSHNSTISNDSDISLLSLSLDKELESNCNLTDIDELPAFEIRLISPLGRTPSPIDSEDNTTPRGLQMPIQERLTPNPCRNSSEFVALHDINAQISPPSDSEEIESSLNRTSSLETIYEGVFLNTPPRQCLNLQNSRIYRNRTNLLEKVALNRINAGKENHSPLTKSGTPPSRRTSMGFSRVSDSSPDGESQSLY